LTIFIAQIAFSTKIVTNGYRFRLTA